MPEGDVEGDEVADRNGPVAEADNGEEHQAREDRQDSVERRRHIGGAADAVALQALRRELSQPARVGPVLGPGEADLLDAEEDLQDEGGDRRIRREPRALEAELPVAEAEQHQARHPHECQRRQRQGDVVGQHDGEIGQREDSRQGRPHGGFRKRPP